MILEKDMIVRISDDIPDWEIKNLYEDVQVHHIVSEMLMNGLSKSGHVSVRPMVMCEKCKNYAASEDSRFGFCTRLGVETKAIAYCYWGEKIE